MGLNKEQAEAVAHVYGPMLVLAGPGSGKTFTLVERVRHMIEDVGIPPGEILVITFSKKAALEMQARFQRLIGEKYYPVSFGTFHAIFYHILKQYNSYSSDSVLTPNKKIEYMKAVCKRLNINQIDSETWLSDTLAKISLYKTTKGTTEEKLFQLNLDEENKQLFVSIYEEYNKYVVEHGKIDFDDMLYKCYDTLKSNQNILNYWRNVYKYFLVDEFQDINDVQYDVLMLLAGKNRNIFAVGDDDQSIYGFRGSKPSFMRDFSEHNSECRIVNLCKNYRCPDVVIDSAARLICNNTDRINKCQIAAKKDKSEGKVIINSFLSEKEEADFVVNEILRIKEEIGYLRSTAILYRTNRCVGFIEEKLAANSIAYDKSEKPTSYYNLDWVTDIVTYLRIAIGERDRTLFYRVLNKPDRDLTREGLKSVTIDINNPRLYDDYPSEKSVWDKLVRDIDFISKLSPFAAVTYILNVVGYANYMKLVQIKKGNSLEAINEMMEEIKNRSKEFNDIRSWIEYIDMIKENIDKQVETVGRIGGCDSTGKVTLMTAHASKGLEFDNVFIIGLQEGLFPHNKAVTKESVEEERRLMYVAVTRSRKNLYICGRGDNEHGKHVSRFVKEIEDYSSISSKS